MKCLVGIIDHEKKNTSDFELLKNEENTNQVIYNNYLWEDKIRWVRTIKFLSVRKKSKRKQE